MNKIKRYITEDQPQILNLDMREVAAAAAVTLGMQQSPAVVSLLAAKQLLPVCFLQSSFSFKKNLRGEQAA